MRSLNVLFVFAAGAGAAFAQPAVTSVANAASNLPQGLPNSGIAQGAIFIVQGTGLGPDDITFAPAAFQSATLAGTSISITVGSTTVSPLMYYSSAGQLGALLPSNTPAGAGTLTVTYGGATSTAFNVQVVANNIGMFTLSQDGEGVAIATYSDYSLVSAVPGTGSLADTCTQPNQACPFTYRGAANPGDVITLWATGLGAVSGGDGSGSLGQTNAVSMTLWIGGVSVPVAYQGRSGCCIGEDQIIFTMPDNAGSTQSGAIPGGCAVPVVIQIGSLVSNSTLMPIAASGRSCTPQSPALTSSIVQALSTATGPLNFAFAQLGRQLFSASTNGSFYEDFVQMAFGQISLNYNAQPTQPVAASFFDTTPPGTCLAYNALLPANPVTYLPGNPALITYLRGIDPGAVNIIGASGAIPLVNKGGNPALWGDVLSPQGTYFSQGQYALTGSGGKDIDSFSTKFTIAPTPTWTGDDQNRLETGGVTRTSGLTLNWTVPPASAAAYNVLITGTSGDGTGQTGASFECVVPSGPGTFTVPELILLALPAGPGEVDFRPALPSQSITANHLDVGMFTFQYQTSVFPQFK